MVAEVDGLGHGAGGEFAEAFDEEVVESGGFEAAAGFGAPGEALVAGDALPGVVESGAGEDSDGVAEGKLAVVVGVEVAAREPGFDGEAAVGELHGLHVAEELVGLIVADGGDVGGAFGGIAAAVGLEVVAVDHEESGGGLEGGEGEAAGDMGNVGLPGFGPGALAGEFGGDADLLGADFAGLGVEEAADDVDDEAWDGGAEEVEGVPVVDFDADEDIGVHGLEGGLTGFEVGGGLGGGGGGAFAGEPLQVPGNDFEGWALGPGGAEAGEEETEQEKFHGVVAQGGLGAGRGARPGGVRGARRGAAALGGGRGGSVVEHELFGIEQGPEEVLEDGEGVFGFGGDGVEDGFEFGFGGRAGESALVEEVDDFGGGFFLFEEAADEFALGDALGGDVAVHEVEGLAEVGVHFDFAGADAGALGAAEGAEEVVGDIAVGDLDGAGALGQAVEFILGLGDLGEGIEHDLGALAAEEGVGEIAFVAAIGVVEVGAELVAAAVADVADEAFEIVLVLGEALAEGVEEFGVGGGVGDADVVDGLDDADAEEVAPDDVGEVFGEEGVFGAGEPLDEDLAAVFGGFFGDDAAEELGLGGLFGNEVVYFAGAGVEDDGFAGVFGLFAADLGEEGGEAIVVVHGPAVEGVVVALGALEAHAHEDLGDVFGDFEGIALDLEVVGGGVGESAAGGAEEFLDDLVKGDVFGEAFLEPIEVE